MSWKKLLLAKKRTCPITGTTSTIMSAPLMHGSISYKNFKLCQVANLALWSPNCFNKLVQKPTEMKRKAKQKKTISSPTHQIEQRRQCLYVTFLLSNWYFQHQFAWLQQSLKIEHENGYSEWEWFMELCSTKRIINILLNSPWTISSQYVELDL